MAIDTTAFKRLMLEINFRQKTMPHDVMTMIAVQALSRDERWHARSVHHYRLFHLGALPIGICQ
jgi:hypothetical protein